MKESVSRLEKWYLSHHRALPWRKTSDPYAVWLSEVMLQQTQVATVIPYFYRFLERFPNVSALAKAKESEVLSLWSGLGYYSRARNLHKGAQYIVSVEKGVFPTMREAWLRIPGIGPYTAGAVLSIAFDLAVPIVDGNVFRVFSRYFGYRKSIDIPKNQSFFWTKAEAWVRAARSPRVLNQALMELGATVCTKAKPVCAHCPLEASCVAHRRHLQEVLPVRQKRKKAVFLNWRISIFQKNNQVYLVKNPEGAWWAGLWDLPHHKKYSRGTLVGQHRHTVTHHKIVARAYLERGMPPKDLKGKWFSKAAALEAPISSLSRKILSSI